MRLMAMDDIGNISAIKLKEIEMTSDPNYINQNIIDLVNKRIPKLSVYGYSVLELALASKNDLENAIKIAKLNILDQENLKYLSVLLIESNKIEESFFIINKITESYFLAEIANKFIEKDDLENTFKVIDKITEDSALYSIANKFIEKNDSENAFKVIDKITEASALSNVVIKFIEKNDLENAFKLIDKISNQALLGYFINTLIIKDRPVEAAKIAEKITSDIDLNNIALKLSEKNFIKESRKVTDLIAIPTSLRIAYYKVSNMLSSYTQILPVAEAIDESSYRKVDNSDL